MTNAQQTAARRILLDLDEESALLIRDALDILSPDEDEACDLRDALILKIDRLLFSVTCDVCNAPGPNPCDACLPGCVAEEGDPSEGLNDG